MEGQLSQRPLAELIRELVDTGASGALRLARGVAKVVVYFDSGELIFATSNLRPHRLREVLQRNGFDAAQLDAVSANCSDEELAAALVKAGQLKLEALKKLRTMQAADVLRVSLLWTEGHWHFDQRVRIAAEMRAPIEIDRLLLECARRLPLAFVKARLENEKGPYVVGPARNSLDLLAAEASILSQAAANGNGFQLADVGTNGLSAQDAVRALYALSLSGFLRGANSHPPPDNAKSGPPKVAVANQGDNQAAASDVQSLFDRVDNARDYYGILNVSPVAGASEIKSAYHTLAMHFHPDHFHQSELRERVESAFAQIAQAYETLSDARKRQLYDQKKDGKSSGKVVPKTDPGKPSGAAATDSGSRAEISFKNGVKALGQNQIEDAIRFLAEAAMLEPREARYRAQYGRALMQRANSRRLAEAELQAAIALQPNHAPFRLMLAELYQHIGLRRRAETEAARALTSDPTSSEARALLAKLRQK